MNKYEILKTYFGYDSFREGQESIIDSILEGRDVLAVMPTGAGKSLCYQVPALLLPGITVVISPLISLMNDQVRALNEAGVHAAYINGSLSEKQITKALQYAAQGKYKMIYVAPERLMTYEFTQFVSRAEISMVTVDEAHCISQWGQDFRPSYLKINDFIRSLGTRPIVSAFTATATREVREDILCVLALQEPQLLVMGFDRKNLFFSVEPSPHKDNFIMDYLAEHRGESGIIYCATRKNVDALYERLAGAGLPAARYHAGMGNEERRQSQDDFIYDRKPVMIATNAFGMGIDKSNVRYVLHYNMPQNLENYYQEAGRAGRDGEAAECILLYSPQDIMINRFLLDNKETGSELSGEEAALVRERDEARLRDMTGYCTTTRCLRAYILHYFGEMDAKPCANCSNCLREYIEEDVTELARHVIGCVYELRQRFGINVVAGTLLGRNTAKLRECSATQCESYGVLKGEGEGRVKQVIQHLLQEGLLALTNDKYTIVKITAAGMEFWRGEEQKPSSIVMRTLKMPESKETKQEGSGRRARISDTLNSRGLDLFEKLRSLRSQLAREAGVPPYIIFSDRTLLDMCVKVPLDREELLLVNGVGQNKCEKYGGPFLEAVSRFTGGTHEKLYYGDGGEYQAPPEQALPERREKAEFALTRQQAQAFVCRDRYLAAELAADLNALADGSAVKKLTGKAIFTYMQSLGYVEEKRIDGRWCKVVSQEGTDAGLVLGERISKAGNAYEDLYYTERAQRLVVEHFVRGGERNV